MLLLLSGALAVGLPARVFRLGERTLTHPEAFVPGWHYPDYVTDPPQSMTPLEVMRAALVADVHPPGYQLIMLAWNRIFGTELFAIRASSVVFGLLAVLALFAYARPLFGTPPALLAAWLLALHGAHVFWSQSARPWALLSFLGVVSALLLQRIHVKWNSRAAIGYALVTGAGLWVDYYFWPLFAAQVGWVLLTGARRTRMPRVLAAQAGAFILAAPVLIYVREHMVRPSHLGGPVWPFLLQSLQFGGVFRPRMAVDSVGSLAPVLSALLAVAGASALAAGLVRHSKNADVEDAAIEKSSRKGLFALASASALTTIVVEFVFARSLGFGHRSLIIGALVLPWIITAVWIVAERTWPVWSGPLRQVNNFRPLRPLLNLPVMLSVGVLLMGALMHQRKGFLAEYALVSFTPFWLAPMAAGLLKTGRLRSLTVAATLIVFVSCLSWWEWAPNSARDYKTFAARLIPNVQRGDLIWMRALWVTTPMHYYLPPEQFTIVPPPLPGTRRASAAAPAQSVDRVWVIDFGTPEGMQARFSEIGKVIPRHHPARSVAVPGGAAMLFVRGSTGEAGQSHQ